MIKLSITVLLVWSIFFAQAQDRNSYGTLDKHPLSTINYENYKFEELKPIADLFKKHDIVILAESSHMEGATLDAQSMIIKAMVDSGIVNTIYYEGGSLSSIKIASLLADTSNDAFKSTLPYVCCRLVPWLKDDLWVYMLEKVREGKLRIVGFDIEGNATHVFIEMFYQSLLLPSVNKLKNSDTTAFKKLQDVYSSVLYFYAYDTEFSEKDYDFQMKYINGILNEVENPITTIKWQTLKNYLNWIYIRQDWKKSTQPISGSIIKDICLYDSYRDSVMANILLNDYNSNKNVKAIAVMSAYHALSNPKSIKDYHQHVPDSNHFVGDILKRELPNKVYSIIFPTSEGYRGQETDFYPKSRQRVFLGEGTLEAFYKKKNYDYFFAPLSTSSLSNNSFPMSIVFSKFMNPKLPKSITAKWGQMYDGILYIKKMYVFKTKDRPEHYYNADSLKEQIIKKYDR